MSLRIPEEVERRLKRFLERTIEVQRRIDPDFFIASLGFHRTEIDGWQIVYEIGEEKGSASAYVLCASR